MIKILRTASFLLCTAVSAPAMAQDYAEGLEAYQAGDYKTALQEWRPLAEQGDAQAQYTIATMYFAGEGVIQDHVIAHMWFNISSANGKARSSEARGLIEQFMTREQIAGSQALARRCMASGYQDCG
jgi:TPR repeat protein